MSNEREMIQEMCEIGRRVYERGMVAANDGNFSVKLNENEFLCTPTGVSKGFMTPEAICRIDADGRLLEANGNFKPSSEMKMHLRVYKERSDVQAVVHAHPPYATTFAAAGIPLEKPVLSEAILTLGKVPVARYGTPSTQEVPDAVAEYLPYYDAMLLANHGALTYGDSLMNAYHKMESVEFYARILYQIQMLGGAKELSPEQVEDIYEIRRKSGMAGRHPALFPEK
ncbi:MAG: class II aldolase/adducin family protein [Lachnospiraceae bacterium]|nr:class II aldolase/adducin family protein [Lachnospiraceae bacterium]MDE6186434.1 class II aldolase/adducin family protein [Lachnospiraceae bacterium]MDE7286929.1 class II aldolase/adducin family protein [Lachnospiraceae bacterium]